MDQAQLNWLINFIWNIADDVLRDVYVRGKYRDVILPMTVLRRLDAVLEPTKQAVLEMKTALDKEQITNQDDALRSASGQAFYNTSPFLLRDLKARSTQQKLKHDFEAYLDGFSPNVQDILTNFEFRNQIPRLSKADVLGMLIEKFLDKDINIGPFSLGDMPGLDNHSMGTLFEELVRRFNEDNNEEAGEHWTPRDAVRLMANLMFLPNMLSKMKHNTPLGSRIAEVHNGSSLFTGDAGQGESNIRRWIIESDWLEAIVALPLNLFYNTGIATYIWVLTNRKPAHRQGKVQLIDASQWFKPLRKNMGKKNCELAADDIQRICATFLAFKETPQSKIFPNAAFGYWKVKIERPLRLHSQLSRQRIETLRYASGDEAIRAWLYEQLGDALFENPTRVCKQLEQLISDYGKGESEPDDDEDSEASAKKSIPESKKKKLLTLTQIPQLPVESAFNEVLTLIQAAKQRAYQAVNSELVTLYWQVGECISGKLKSAEWGDGVVNELASFLARTQPGLRGFTRASLFRTEHRRT